MDLFNVFLLRDVWEGIEEAENRRAINALQRQRRMLRDQQNPLEWTDLLFKQTFRLTKEVFVALRDDLAELVGPQYPTRRALTLEQKILVTLQFYATGSYQRITGAASNMAQPTTSMCIREVTNLLNTPAILDRWIHFPQSAEEIAEVRLGFYEKFQFPGVLGVVDGSFVNIIRPTEHEDQYFNRKGNHSLNIMVICDSEAKILALNASFGGVNHDSHVWNMSAISRHVQRVSNGVMWLIGDSGYALRPWMLTPFYRPPAGTPEARYNDRLTSTRSTIERCIGIWKSRWRCILKHRVLHYDPVTSSKIVNACAVLHNMMHDAEIDFSLVSDHSAADHNQGVDGNQPQEVGAGPNVNLLNQGRAVRNRVVQMLQEEV